jgi:hypothetical protein
MHHERNRAPRPPNPKQLNTIRSHQRDMDIDDGHINEPSGNDSGDEADSTTGNDRPSRAKRHTRKPYMGSTNDPKKFGFYPPQWRDVLEAARKKWRCWIAYECAFPDREHMTKALECIVEALSEHQELGKRVEPGMFMLSTVLRLITHCRLLAGT